jgi:hypothetical protein
LGTTQNSIAPSKLPDANTDSWCGCLAHETERRRTVGEHVDGDALRS